jgi:hypothetical protein
MYYAHKIKTVSNDIEINKALVANKENLRHFRYIFLCDANYKPYSINTSMSNIYNSSRQNKQYNNSVNFPYQYNPSK